MITFDPKGNITIGEKTFTGCYSGHPNVLNDPSHESEKGTGRLPRGVYNIGVFFDSPHFGPVVANLTQLEGDNFGRSGFMIHGDNKAMNHTASDGCVVCPHDVRVAIRDSGDNRLRVT